MKQICQDVTTNQDITIQEVEMNLLEKRYKVNIAEYKKTSNWRDFSPQFEVSCYQIDTLEVKFLLAVASIKRMRFN